MMHADVRLEWGAGAIERSVTEIEERLNEMVERWLNTAPLEEEIPAPRADDAAAGQSAA